MIRGPCRFLFTYIYRRILRLGWAKVPGLDWTGLDGGA
jgi:hypothetical protein